MFRKTGSIDMSYPVWDAREGRCVEMPDLPPGALLSLPFFADAEPEASGYQAADAFLQAVRGMGGQADVARFNSLIKNPDYRRRFFEAYPLGREAGINAAAKETIDEVDQLVRTLMEGFMAMADDQQLALEVAEASAYILAKPGLTLSSAENERLNNKLAGIRKRLFPSLTDATSPSPMPLQGFRDTTRGLLQILNSLMIWKNLIQLPSRLNVGMASVDSALQSGRDWSQVLVGAEDDITSLLSATAEGLFKLNCDPDGQGYNLGWVCGYIGVWAATTVIFETLITFKSPL